MKNFDDYLKIVLKNEGGYSNNINDPGSETYKGVSRKFEKNWDGWIIIDSYKNKPNFPYSLKENINLDKLVEKVYYENYWLPMNLDIIEGNELLKLHLFDMGVNSGIRNAIKLLQAILDTNADGILGKNTNYAIARYGKSIVEDYKIARKHYYSRIIEKNPKLEVFRKGWENRVDNTKF